MAVAAALHRSANKKLLLEKEVVEGTHSARLGQKTAAGTRPAPLAEVAEPQVGAVTVGYVAAPEPLLSTPSLADTMADQVDDRAVQILLQMALKKKKREEEKEERRRQEEVAEHERRMRVLDRRVWADEELTPGGVARLAPLGRPPPGKEEEEEEEEEEETSSQLFTSSLGCPASWSVWTRRTFLPPQRPLPLPALYALGNLDFLRATGIWHPVRCLSRRRSTGKFQFFGSSLRGIISAAPCIWQSLVRCILRPDSLVFRVRHWSTRVWIFLEDEFWYGFRIQHSLVRQWIHAWRHSTRPFGFHTAENCGLSAVAVHRR